MSKRILVIEDTEDNRQIIRDLLSSAGYEMIEAVDGIEGVAVAERERPDLILMDIQLPGVSGLEVTKWIKEDAELCSIPIIAVTAFAMRGDEETFRQGGCDGYIAKPISVDKFLEVVEQFLSAVP